MLLFFSSDAFTQTTEKWGNQGDGTYVNPLIPADYSDIDAIRVGKDYYAISSTFQFSPGVIILHSKDLLNWNIMGHVVSNLNQISPELNWNKMNRYGKGIWAGSIRYHKGKFWVYFGTPDEGFFMSTAKKATGPWQPLQQVMKAKGWDDCCPFWDDNGKAYFIATHFADNYKIHLFRMSADGKQIFMKSDSVIHQSQGSEANKLYKINGYYYHFFSEVKEEGRVAMIERSKNIYGPYETRQLNHVNPSIDKEPNQGGLIELASGNWWFLTHQGTGSWEGRAMCLLPVTFINDWPIIGKVGTDTIGNMVWTFKNPVSISVITPLQKDDEFNLPFLSPHWEWNYQPRNENWSLTERKGYLRLHAFIPASNANSAEKRKLFYSAGNTLTQRSMRTAKSRVTIKIDVAGMVNGEYGGLCHFSDVYTTIGIKQNNGIRTLFYDNNGKEKEGAQIRQTVVWLQSTWDWQGKNNYAYSLDGKIFTAFGDVSQLTWGFYRGDRISIYNYNKIQDNGFVDVDWFHYRFANPKGIYSD